MNVIDVGYSRTVQAVTSQTWPSTLERNGFGNLLQLGLHLLKFFQQL